MTYQPDVVVELAFGSGYSTPAASRSWTDVSSKVEADQGITIGFGRPDELSTADANSLSLTLDNSDGRFTAGLASGAYYPNVKIGTPIRVTTTPVGGSASVRFVGFVDEWPVTWDGTDNYAAATITASSRLARVGLDAGLRSIIEETYALDSPIAHYPFSEAEGATSAADISGNAAPSLQLKGMGAAPVFGTATGPATDSLTAVTTSGGKYLGVKRGLTLGFNTLTIEGFFSSSDPTGGTIFFVGEDVLPGGPWVALIMDGSGALYAWVQDVSYLNAAAANSSGGYDDGTTRHIALVWNQPTVSLYIDGALIDTSATGAWTGGTIECEQFAGNFPATLAHFAIYDRVLTSGEIAAHAAAGLTGFAGEATDDRLARYALLAGIASTEISAEAGVTTCAHVDSTDATAVDLMRQVETTEGGVLFDAPDGTLTFHNRSHRYGASAAITLDMAAQLIVSDFAPKYDRTGLVNDATGTNAAGTVTGRSIDTTSRDYYGPASTSITTLSTDDEEPYQVAAWTVATRSEPIARVPSLSVNLLDFDAYPSQDDVLALTIGSRVDVTNQPDQAADTDASYFVEGYAETITGTTYELTFNVSPGATWLNVAVFDDPDRGFDSGCIFAY